MASTGADIVATIIRHVEGITIFSATQIDVLCKGGIGKFSLAAPADLAGAVVTVTMYYEDGKPFSKLEGVDITADAAQTANILGPNTFTLELAASVEVQVIDFYR